MIQKIGRGNVLYPMPVTLVGALVGGRPNLINIAHVGIWNAGVPHTITLGMAKIHYTNAGIREQRTFSVNIPSQGMVEMADYIGLVSGRSVDKSGLFDIIYGELAPRR